jgi:hypothetical protein
MDGKPKHRVIAISLVLVILFVVYLLSSGPAILVIRGRNWRQVYPLVNSPPESIKPYVDQWMEFWIGMKVRREIGKQQAPYQ